MKLSKLKMNLGKLNFFKRPIAIKFLAIAVMGLATLSSCSDDDDPEPVNEEEVITTVTVTLVNGSDTVTLKSYDADGEGSGAPVITVSGNLKAGTTYNGTIKLLNETESPAENITEEVEEEGKEHQFFFSSTNGTTFAYTDKDGDGNPIGITFTLTTAGAGNDTITVILRHEPNKTATGVSGGDITNAGGSTDVEAAFGVTIE